MLKECYYFDQTEYDYKDYMFLCRYIDRMVQYRDSTKGSYDGEKRISEISRIDLSRLTDKTKIILSYYIHLHKAEELLKLKNLQGLSNIEIIDLDFLKEPGITSYNGKGTNKHMKLSVEEFYSNLKVLNDEINKCIENGDLPEDYVFEIKCIGGFAMSYWSLRDKCITEDMDSLIEINQVVKDAIKTIAAEKALPNDWVNDIMTSFYDASGFHWYPVKWLFGRKTKIKVYVCSKEDLLKNKLSLAEKYLEGVNLQDRNQEIDYIDAKNILSDMHMAYGTNTELIKINLSNMGINIKDYPKMYEEIILKGIEPEPEDAFIFDAMNKVNNNQMSIDDFLTYVNDTFGYDVDSIKSYYGIYFDEFPIFEKAINHREIDK